MAGDLVLGADTVVALDGRIWQARGRGAGPRVIGARRPDHVVVGGLAVRREGEAKRRGRHQRDLPRSRSRRSTGTSRRENGATGRRLRHPGPRATLVRTIEAITSTSRALGGNASRAGPDLRRRPAAVLTAAFSRNHRDRGAPDATRASATLRRARRCFGVTAYPAAEPTAPVISSIWASSRPHRLRRPRHGGRPRHGEHARLRPRARHRAIRTTRRGYPLTHRRGPRRGASRPSGCSAGRPGRSRRRRRDLAALFTLSPPSLAALLGAARLARSRFTAAPAPLP